MVKKKKIKECTKTGKRILNVSCLVTYKRKRKKEGRERRHCAGPDAGKIYAIPNCRAQHVVPNKPKKKKKKKK